MPVDETERARLWANQSGPRSTAELAALNARASLPANLPPVEPYPGSQLSGCRSLWYIF